ncbi:MAG: hypothetical protein HPY76_07025 [Anaerolineae bacterium]|jgi:peptidyl-prolyl cis-trans isomerase C|nr:hypothetical protein [Anaerolineae bacterium]
MVVLPTATVTPQPLAASVNGEGILLADFEAEVARLQAAAVETGTELQPDQINSLVIDELIDQVLLAQTARNNGFRLGDEDLDSRIDALAQGMDGTDALNSWLQQNFYTQESFRNWMRIGIEASWQQDQWLAEIPTTADQVHVRQIFVKDQGEANSAYQQLVAGVNFLELAYEYDSLTGGDLGWLIPGYVFYPQLDEAIFDLDVGQFSNIVETEIGYHLVYIEEKEANRALTSDMQDKFREDRFDALIDGLREASNIEVYVAG